MIDQTAEHVRRVPIAPELLTRWQAAAAELGVLGDPLVKELAFVAACPCRANVDRAGRAARFAEAFAVGAKAIVANTIAEEIEMWAAVAVEH